MPANLPPQYIEAKRKYELSKDVEEKIELLQLMVSIMPKHKGTNKLLGEVRSKLASLRKEALAKPPRRKHHDVYRIVRQGAGQAVIIGYPNVGKSRLISRLTHADSHVAAYPFTTDKPIVGMMLFENINIQLIDTPPITNDFFDPRLIDLIQCVDIVLLVLDAGSDDALDQIESISGKLADAKIKLTSEEAEYEASDMEWDAELTESTADNFIHRKGILIANKSDLEGSQERIHILRELYSKELFITAISAENDPNFETLKRLIFDNLNIIRVYTKPVGKKPDLNDPIVLHNGSVVVDAATEIHRDFGESLKFAKIWGGEKEKYNGQRVSRDHPLEDGNILEFHISE